MTELQHATAIIAEMSTIIRDLRMKLDATTRADVIRAGEFLPRGQMVVVDEETKRAYAFPKTKTEANKLRIYGRVQDEYRAGEAVSIKAWWLEDIDL